MNAEVRYSPDVVLAILTGQRPGLLKRTLESLPPWTLSGMRTVVFHNTGDKPTADVLDSYKWDLRATNLGELWDIGSATTYLLKMVKAENRPFTLLLQDDWAYNGVEGWLADAIRVLDDDPRCGQVRLRWQQEKVKDRNLVSGEEIRWFSRGDHLFSHNAHFTFNPTLMRTCDLIVPVTGEKHAMREFHRSGLGVAQSLPGVFRHIGGGHLSLRRKVEIGERALP